MPFTLTWDGQGLIKHLSGFVSAREFMDTANASTSHPDFDRARYVINDFTDVTGHDLDTAAAEYVAVMRLGASAQKTNMRVIYVSTDESIRAFVRLLTMPPYDCIWETRVFDTLDAAMNWLRQQPPLPQRLF